MTDDPGREAGDERPQERLGFLRPRDRHFDPYRSRRVGRLRLVLPLGAALVLALLVLWPKLQPSRIKKMVVANIPNLVIQNLHFTGLDSKNEPYSLTAARATRPAGLKNVYDFVQPRGEITLLSGAWIAGR
ncbi:MAG TPA: hypothetical protein VMV79_00800, partial [Alphaproteobacteria bacterium]|nr:hypothetical protein [Alphaproteobacteria bacterium]